MPLDKRAARQRSLFLAQREPVRPTCDLRCSAQLHSFRYADERVNRGSISAAETLTRSRGERPRRWHYRILLLRCPAPATLL